jgi:hypothetical protein
MSKWDGKPLSPEEALRRYKEQLRGIRAQRLGEQALQAEEDERAYKKVLQRLVRDGYVVKKEGDQ